MSKDIILIGGIDKRNPKAIGGEIIKNHLFIMRFNEIYDRVITVDTANWKRRPWLLLELLWKLLYFRKARVVVSCSANGSRFVINLLYSLRLRKGSEIVLWWVGGRLTHFLETGFLDIKKLVGLSYIVVQGQRMVEEARLYGLNNVVYVPNSKPIVFRPQIKERDELQPFRFVFMSRINEPKGVCDILEACEDLNNSGFHGRFFVDFYGVIETGFATQFKEKLGESAYANYMGYLDLSTESGYKVLSSYDTLLFPTYWDGEGFPGVVVDAYIAGVPIIASEHNLNSSVVVNGVTGVLVPKHNPRALSRAMREMMTDSTRLMTMRKNCLDEARRYDTRTVLSEELLSSLDLL